MPLVRQVWQKPAVSWAAQLVTILWPFTGDLRGGLGQIIQRGIRVTGGQQIGHRGAAGHLCLLALLVALRTCVHGLNGSLTASLGGVRGCTGRLGSRRALGGDADTLCGSGCSCGCWCCCWCCCSSCHRCPACWLGCCRDLRGLLVCSRVAACCPIGSQRPACGL